MGLLSAIPRRQGLLGMLQRPDDMAYQANPVIRPAAEVMAQVPQAQAPAPPQSLLPQRQRVSGWRLLDRVLGGQTITGGLDAERARLEQEAMRPQLLAQRQQTLASITDPRERALYMTDPEEWAKNIGQQFAPQVVAPGAVQAIGGRAVVGAPQQYEFGDTRRSFNPVTGQDTVVATRGPTIAEQTAIDRLDADRVKQAADIEISRGQLGVAQGNLGVNQGRLGLDQSTAGVTLSPGQVRFNADGSPVASVAAPANPQAAATAQAVAGFEANNERFRNIITMIKGDPEKGVAPSFDLSPVSALRYRAELATGRTSPAAAAYGNYQSEIDSAVSDALRLNTGPQTDQDAIREARALLSNRDNRAYVLERLPTLIRNNERLARARQAGAAPASGPSAPTGVAQPRSAAEYQALPSGALFRAPDGTTRRKP